MIDLGGRVGYIHNSKVKVDKGLSILMYHQILDRSEVGNRIGSTTITTEQFASEMNYLHQQGFETIYTSDLEKYVAGQINLPAKTTVITFDDGLISVRENAYPILKQYGMKATEYMITYRNNHKTEIFVPEKLQYFSREDMNNLNNVFDYQAHTHNLHNINHSNLSDLITKPYSTVKADIQLNKNILNAHSFAYPFGQYNDSTLKVMKELGINSAVTTKEGYVNVGDNPLLLKRFGVYRETSLTDFSNIVQ
ncbi:polysaccharide deacetylase family protein [[Brevibacterium] frigoritolerans]|nr:polysaccharide deacetylase family protein [Peribacillus frigoritolerans]